jgi:hypothetical protein
MLRLATLLLATGALALPAAAGAQTGTIPPPSLTVDTFFAPPNGIADGDFSPTNIIPDIPSAVAVDGDRIYTVGRTGSSISADIGIMARRLDGAFDEGFSTDGKLAIPVAAGSEEDDGRGVVVLPNGRLRILGTTRASTNKDVVVLGLERDGDPDPAFGTADARGNRSKVLTNPGEDLAGRITLGPGGRMAIVGSRKIGGADDTFVALLEADGTPVDGFGVGGVVAVNIGGGTVNDRGVDVAFRPGGGLAVLSGQDSPNKAVIFALDEHGDPDTAFGTAGRITLEPGGTSSSPGGLIEYGEKFYVSGSTTVGSDIDAFLASADATGKTIKTRRFDVRGRFVAANQAATTHAADLVVAPTTPPTLAAVGTVQYSQDGGSTITDWAAAAFSGFEGDITAARYGDLVIPAPGDGGLFSVAAGATGWLAVTGRHVLSADDGFGGARVLVDADKVCDLGVTVDEPAEIVFQGLAPATLGARVTNAGTKPCGGTLTVPAPYAMTPVATGELAPGATFVASAPLTFGGPRRAEDVLQIDLDAPGDANTANNTGLAHVVFSFCDLALAPAGHPRGVPSEGTAGFPVSLRNSGTIACRVRIASKPQYQLGAGQGVADRVPAAAPPGARPGTTVAVRLHATATGDVDAANDAATVQAAVVGVGDSDIRAHGARRFAGTARRGSGALKRKLLRPSRVDVSLLRKGTERCAWLRSASGRFRAGTPRAGGGCTGRRWVGTKGTRHWRLRLAKRLAPGRYVLFSRARIGAGFVEARFSAADRNRVEFRIR